MIQDPNEIYTEAGAAAGEQEPDPKPKVKHPGDTFFQERASRPQNMSRAGASFKVAGVTPSDQQKFFGETGISDPALTGQNIALEAGERQSFGNKLARRVGNLIPNVAANLVDIVGSTGSALFEWGDERDYRNGLNDLADSMRDPAGQNYKRSNDTWAISDPTWWIDNAFNTVEYAAAYGAAGVGTGMALRGVAQGANWLKTAAQLGTSGFMSYAQGAHDGATVFKEVYDNQFMKALARGEDPETAADTAKHIAAQSASTTAQLSTLLTMGINAGAYAPIFKSQEKLSKDIIASRLVGLERTSFGDIAKMIRGTNAADYADRLFHHQGLLGVLDEMVREGGEEVLQQFAEKTGTVLGNKGQIRDFIQQFGEIENIVDRTANSEGLLAFTLGAAFGGIQHGIIHNVVPSRNVERLDASGNPVQKMDGEEPMVDKNGSPVFQKHWVTPRHYERDFALKSFNNTRDAVAHDFDRMDDLQTDFLAAMKKGNHLEAEEIRDEMFNAGKLYAVRSGITDTWKKTFEGIAGMDNATAMEQGFATDENDTNYQDKATEAIGDIDHLGKLYTELDERYGTRYKDMPGLRPLVDMVFAREADLYSTRKRLDTFKKTLEADELKENRLANSADPSGLQKMLGTYTRQLSSAREVERQLIEDSNTLVDALKKKDTKSLDRLLRKYRAIGYGDGNYAEDVKNLNEKLNRKQAQAVAGVQAAEQALFSNPDYQGWLEEHPGGNFDTYLKELNQRNHQNAQNLYRRSQLDQAEAAYEIAKQNLAEITEEKNAKRFARKAEEWAAQMVKETEQIEEQRATKLAEATKDRTTLKRLKSAESNRIADQYQGQAEQAITRYQENLERLAQWKAELKKTVKDPVRAGSLRSLIRKTEAENTALTNRINMLDSLVRKYRVEPEMDKDVEIEDVTGEQDGKTTEDASSSPGTFTSNGTTDTGTVPVFETDLDKLFSDMESTEDGTQADDFVVEEYTDLVTKAHSAVQHKMGLLLDGMMSGEFGFSLDSLNKEIVAGVITEAAARKLLLSLRDYVNEMKNLVKANEEQLTEEKPKPVTEQADSNKILVNGPSVPDSPATQAAEELIDNVPESQDYHAGYKIVEAAYTGASSTIGFEEGTRKLPNGDTVFIKVTKPDALVKPVIQEILDPNSLPPGHELLFEVDWNYEGEKKITDSLSWDEKGEVVEGHERGADYLTADGLVKADTGSIGNVPIRVLDKATGKFLFHIRKMDYINAKFPGTKDYRNIAESTETDPDNIGTQRRLLMQLRTAIVEQYNHDRSAFEGKMGPEGKGTGRLILNYVIKSKDAATLEIKAKVEPRLAWNFNKPEESMLPDESLDLVIVSDGNVLTKGKNVEYDKPTGFAEDLPKGAVGAMVPSANKKFMYVPLVGQKLVEEGKPSAGLNSVVRAIELYILNDGTNPEIGKEILALEQLSNFNVSTARGLKAFINQYYTYTQGFPDSALSPNAGDGREGFLFSIDDKAENVLDKTKQIKVGFAMRGDGAKYANLANGSLAPDFVAALTEGFSTRSRAVVYTDASLGIKGINSRGTFQEIFFVPGKGWKNRSHKSYNQYVKSFSRTPVYGRNQLPNGKYVYVANPHLSIAPITPKPKLLPNNSAVEVKIPVKDQTQLDSDLLDEISNFSYRKAPASVQAMGTGSDNSVALSVASLQEKYNFTPESQRNGKTVLEVYDSLVGRGHTYLSEGYNPFSRCL